MTSVYIFNDGYLYSGAIIAVGLRRLLTDSAATVDCYSLRSMSGTHTRTHGRLGLNEPAYYCVDWTEKNETGRRATVCAVPKNSFIKGKSIYQYFGKNVCRFLFYMIQIHYS